MVESINFLKRSLNIKIDLDVLCYTRLNIDSKRIKFLSWVLSAMDTIEKASKRLNA